MKKLLTLTRLICLGVTIVVLSLLYNNLPTTALEIRGIEFMGEAILPKKLMVGKTEVGGLSGITYNGIKDLFYAVSDDRGQKASPRFYTFKIDLGQGLLEKNAIIPLGVTTLLNSDSKPLTPGKSDTEGIAFTNHNTVFISSEGDTKEMVTPFIKEFSLESGEVMRTLPIPEKFLPDEGGRKGIRNNLGFESLTITPNNQYLFTATENALAQDGTAAQPRSVTNCRIIQYNLKTNQAEKEFLYKTEPVPQLFNLTGRFVSGLPDLVALDNHGNFLSLERSFTGFGFAVSLFQVSLAGADDISKIDSLSTVSSEPEPVKKKLLLDLSTLDVVLDNIEGLTLGSWLPGDKRVLILVSDNNFNSLQRSQILAFKLELESPLRQFLRRLIPRLGR